jgi:hypothetical protein
MDEAGRIVLTESPEQLLAEILRCESSSTKSDSAAELPELARSLARYFTSLEEGSEDASPERPPRAR